MIFIDKGIIWNKYETYASYEWIMKGYDVRAIANIALDECWKNGRPISNLHLNKMLFFMHVDCLRDKGHPLISAKIEAWEHGPVFREIYNQFKKYKSSAIRSCATKVDFDSGERVEAREELSTELEGYIRELANFYSGIPAWILRDLSHDKGGAWDAIWNHDGEMNVGMEITDETIRTYELPKGKRIRCQ